MPENTEEQKKIGWLGWALILLVVGVIMSLMGNNDEESSSTSSGGTGSSAEVNESLAYEACKDSVNRQLKAPGTSSYPDYWDGDGEVSVTGSGGSWTIASHVDAQNSFGGEVRTSWVCDATMSGDSFTGHATLIG